MRTEIDFTAIIETAGRIERQMGERDRRLLEYLTRPTGVQRNLSRALNVADIPAGAGAGVIDLGKVPSGRMWQVGMVTCVAVDPFTLTTPTSLGAVGADFGGLVPVNQAGTGAASAITLTAPAAANKLTQVSGFDITGTGATAASVVVATLAGVSGGTRSYVIAVPAGATTPIASVRETFSPPLVATGYNQAITLTVPSLGAGNTNAAANMEAQQSQGPVAVAAVMAGTPPAIGAINAGSPPSYGDVLVPAQTVPFSIPLGGRLRLLKGAEHLYVLVQNVNHLAAWPLFHATATVIEVPDSPEAVLAL